VVEHSRSRCGNQKQRERERERERERRGEKDREGGREREREREREKHDPIDILRARPHLLKFPYLTGAEHMCFWRTFSIQIITLRLLNEENKNNEEKNQQLQQFKKMA
jgi:hypothetical protein